MQRIIRIVTWIAMGCATAIAHGAEPSEPTILIERLSDDSFEIRQQAVQKLAALGEGARAALEYATDSKDAEVRQTAQGLLQKLAKSTLTVLAFDRDGKPAAGAEFSIKTYSANSGWNNPTDDTFTVKPDGTAPYTLSRGGMQYFNFTWKKYSSMPAGQSYASLNLQHGSNPCLITLTRGGTVKTHAEDAGGKPLKDATLTLLTASSFQIDELEAFMLWRNAMGQISGTTDEHGALTLENVPDGVYQCIARLDKYDSTAQFSIRVREGETISLPPFKLVPRKIGKLQFTMQDGNAAPLKNHHVYVQTDPVFEGPDAVERRRSAMILKLQMRGQRGDSGFTSDDTGKVVIEDLAPGKYTVTVTGNDRPAQHLENIVVKDGAPTDLGVLKATAAASISGKILDSAGKGVRYAQVTAIREQDLLDVTDGEIPDMHSYPYHMLSVGRTSVQQDGSYILPNLAPGKYVLTVYTRQSRSAVVFGVETTAGQRVSAPDVVLPSAVNGTPIDFKGVVLLPDGSPAAGAIVSIMAGNTVIWNRNTDEAGVFNVSEAGDGLGKGNRILVKLAGYKAQFVDLPKQAPQALTIRLQNQEYGSVLAKVVDEAGKPLSDVEIRPGSRQRNRYNRNPGSQNCVTNHNGETRLSGLVAGERTLQAEREGYFTRGEVKVSVVPDKETEVSVVMYNGLNISGTVEVPQGYDNSNIVVSISSGYAWTCDVRDGKFTAKGLAPGQYIAFAAAPGLVATEQVKVLLSDDKTEIPPLKFKLVRPGALALHFGPEYRGFQAVLGPVDSWNPERSGEVIVPLHHQAAQVDSAGRAEFWGIPPGRYDMMLSPAHNQGAQQIYYNLPLKHVSANQIVTGVEAVPLARAADIATLPAKDLTIKYPNGSARGTLTIKDGVSWNNVHLGQLYVKIVGPDATGIVSFNYPYEFVNQSASGTVVVGTPPNGRKPSQAGTFLVDGLPPGAYKLFVDLTAYDNTQVGGKALPKKFSPAALKSFVLKEGEKLELGEISYKLSNEIRAQIKSLEESAAAPELDDRLPAFEP